MICDKDNGEKGTFSTPYFVFPINIYSFGFFQSFLLLKSGIVCITYPFFCIQFIKSKLDEEQFYVIAYVRYYFIQFGVNKSDSTVKELNKLLTKDWGKKEEDKLTLFSQNWCSTRNYKIFNVISGNMSFIYYKKNIDSDKIKRVFWTILIWMKVKFELCHIDYETVIEFGDDEKNRVQIYRWKSTNGLCKWLLLFYIILVLECR